MKRWGKLISVFVMVVLCAAMFFGCAQSAPKEEPSADYGGGFMSATSANEVSKEAAQAPAAMVDEDISSNAYDLGYTTDSNRKVIKTASVSLESSEYDADKAAILALVQRFGGYVQYASEWGNKPVEYRDDGREAQYTFRIPQDNFESFLSELDKIGKQTNRSMGGDDITYQYSDVETRLKTQRMKLERLEELLLKADKMEDIVSLINAISDTTLQIEQYTAQLNNWDNLVDEASVGVYLQEIVKVDAFEGVKDETFGDKISNAFNSAVAGIIDGVKWIVVAVVSIFPVLLVLAVITAVIAVPIILTQKRKRKRMKAALQEQNKNQLGS